MIRSTSTSVRVEDKEEHKSSCPISHSFLGLEDLVRREAFLPEGALGSASDIDREQGSSASAQSEDVATFFGAQGPDLVGPEMVSRSSFTTLLPRGPKVGTPKGPLTVKRLVAMITSSRPLWVGLEPLPNL